MVDTLPNDCYSIQFGIEVEKVPSSDIELWTRSQVMNEMDQLRTSLFEQLPALFSLLEGCPDCKEELKKIVDVSVYDKSV